MNPGISSHLPAVLALGVVCQIGQIVLLRELLMVFHGNELALGIILAAWMLWVGVGSRWGSRLAERSARPVSLFALTALGVPLLLPAAIALIRVLRGFFTIPPGAYLTVVDMGVACLVVTAPVCLLFGLQFVLLARIWGEADGAPTSSGVSKTYIAEGAGHIIGGLLFTFLLVQVLNAFETAALAGVILPVAALRMLRRRNDMGAPSAPRLRAALAAVLVPTAAAFPFLGLVDSQTYRYQWRVFAPDYDLVETRPSKYGVVSVARRTDQYSFFQSGHLIFSTAGPQAASPGLEEQEARVFAHFSLVQHPHPQRVLLLGGGLRGTLKEILRHPVEGIDYIELDPVLTAAAKPFLRTETQKALEDPRVRLRHTDARRFMKAPGGAYDLIIADLPDPATALLNRYYTAEFFREAAARLNPGGVLVIGAASTPDLRGAAAANRNAAIYHTLRHVFPQVLAVGERFLFFFAGDGESAISADAATLRQRYRERGIDSEGFSEGHFELLLQEGPLRRVNWILRHHGRSGDAHLRGPEPAPLFPGTLAEQQIGESRLPPVASRLFHNSDFRPVGYLHTLVFWDAMTRGGRGGVLAWVVRVEAWWVAVAAGAALAATAGLRRTGRRGAARASHGALLITVFSTGLSTMALQIALLFSFQSLYGFVYEMVGVVVALFMGGLAFGAAAARRFARDRPDLRLLTALQLALAAFCGLLAVALPWVDALTSPGLVLLLFSALTFGAGLFNGAVFPPAAACCRALTGRPEKAAGVVYGVELFGACAGALLASVVVAPVLGIAACCLLGAVGNGTAVAALLLFGRYHGD